jgi:hypothetical protein
MGATFTSIAQPSAESPKALSIPPPVIRRRTKDGDRPSCRGDQDDEFHSLRNVVRGDSVQNMR